MDYKDILTKQEMEILAKANEEISKLKEKLEQPTTGINKETFAKAGRAERFSLLSASLEGQHKLIWDIFQNANKYYSILKGALNKKDNTHEFITERALDLLGNSNASVRKALKTACIQPDTVKSMYKMIYEGHFYGKVKGGGYGNFLKNFFDKTSLILIDLVDDIDETAVSNFTKYYKQALKNNGFDYKTLAWSAHYLQDLTAPHHVGNMAIFFEVITDNTASHFAFEKYANTFVYDNKNIFQAKADQIYKTLKPLFAPKNPEKFAKAVYNRATQNIDKVKNISDWDNAIKDAIPLAIGASAVIFDGI